MKKEKKNKIAVYPGTFDPITNGHLDIIKKVVNLFDELIILIMDNKQKKTLFTLEERIELVKKSIKSLPRVKVDLFDGLLVDYLKKHKIYIIIRGLRAVSDFDYEFQLTQFNRKLFPEAETIFIMPSEEFFFLSSSMVKEIASYKGNISEFVPECVAEALDKKFHEKG